MRMGLREANHHFSRAIKAVRAGQSVILTDRGRSIAVISPLNERKEGDGIEAALSRMAAEGLLLRATRKGPMPPFTPIPIRGKPISETLREMRDGR